jgi:hypothetical protein
MGKKLYHNDELYKSSYFEIGNQPAGWELGDLLREHTCKMCGKTFYTRTRNANVCEDCKKTRDYSHHLTCAICGKPIKNNQKICNNPECVSKYISINNPMHDKSISQKSVAMKKQKYGDDYYQKVWKPKFEKTMIEKYGKAHALQCPQFLDKSNQTIEKTGISYRFHTPEWDNVMMKKYGTTIPNKDKKLNNKRIETLIERYGVTAPAKLLWVQDKIKKSVKEHYDVEYYFQSDDCKKRTKVTMNEKYGVDSAGQLNCPISKINKSIGEYLNVDKYEIYVDGKRFDMIKNGIFIEVDPSVSHSIDNTWFGNHDISFQLNKTKLANSIGHRCIHIFDWDDISKIQSMFSKKKKLYARNCEVALITKEQSDDFLNSYHLQNACSSDKLRVGLIKSDKLIGVMTFGNSRYSSKYEIELLRMCFHPDYEIIGGASKMFRFFTNRYHPNSIVSYCDLSKFTGTVYGKIGMKKVRNNPPSIHWYNEKTKKHYIDSLVIRLGADALLGTNYGNGTNNAEIMLKNGFVRVPDCGQAVYSWNQQ